MAVADTDHQDRADIVDDGECQQKYTKTVRYALAE
jgi:hypothetical protein